MKLALIFFLLLSGFASWADSNPPKTYPYLTCTAQLVRMDEKLVQTYNTPYEERYLKFENKENGLYTMTRTHEFYAYDAFPKHKDILIFARDRVNTYKKVLQKNKQLISSVDKPTPEDVTIVRSVVKNKLSQKEKEYEEMLKSEKIPPENPHEDEEYESPDLLKLEEEIENLKFQLSVLQWDLIEKKGTGLKDKLKVIEALDKQINKDGIYNYAIDYTVTITDQLSEWNKKFDSIKIHYKITLRNLNTGKILGYIEKDSDTVGTIALLNRVRFNKAIGTQMKIDNNEFGQIVEDNYEKSFVKKAFERDHALTDNIVIYNTLLSEVSRTLSKNKVAHPYMAEWADLYCVVHVRKAALPVQDENLSHLGAFCPERLPSPVLFDYVELEANYWAEHDKKSSTNADAENDADVDAKTDDFDAIDQEGVNAIDQNEKFEKRFNPFSIINE